MSTSTSTIDPSIPPLTPTFDPNGSDPESEYTQALIEKLDLQTHGEGGYFKETDRNSFRIPNPFALQSKPSSPTSLDCLVSNRCASTTIYYLLTPQQPLGMFHRNRARTVHTLHRGRGRYVIIHADEVGGAEYPGDRGTSGPNLELGEEMRWTGKARVETFVVGPNILEGERVQWVVSGGKYKASFLLPDDVGGDSSDGLLISETVVPGFEWDDHDFMQPQRLEALVGEEQKAELEWMLLQSRKDNER